MSKKQSKQPTKAAPPKPVKPARPAPGRWPDRPATATVRDPFFKKIFLALALAILLITSMLALGSGINGDDEYQNDYSQKLVGYYSTMGADTAALNIPKGNMHYYGGLFDIVTGFSNSALGLGVNDLGYHHVRHLWNALFGCLAMFFTALFVREIAGWRGAILALLLMFLSPRFLGHSLMNPKDIPFAMGYIMSLYFMVRLLRQLPVFNWKLALGVATGLAIATATRAGGLILVGILGLFAGLDFLQKNGLKGMADVKKVGMYAANVIGISLAGLLLAVLFWPWALQDPLGNPFEALGAFEKLEIKIRVLFDGLNTMSDETPWDYPLQWIWRTIPLFALLGLLGSLVFLPKILKRYQPLPVLLALFAAVFPIFYVIYKDSVLHDGWRHLTFTYPAMVVLATLFFLFLENKFVQQKTATYALYAVVGLMALEPAVYILRNAKFPYTYFSPVAGGISGAFGKYETDYWGLSCRPALEWMEARGIIKPGMTNEVTVATSFAHPVKTFVEKRYGGKVKVIYQRFNQRYERAWDYGIFPSRYIRGAHLQAGRWPNARSIHAVTANGVPLLSIEKGGGPVFDGEVAFKEGDFATAAKNFEAEVEMYPDNELAWMKLAMSYLNLSNFQASRNAADNMLKVAPDNTSGLFYRGIATLNSGDANAAELDFKRSIEIEEDMSQSWYYLALIKQGRKDSNGALQDLQKAIEKNPRFKQAYELAAQIYEEKGDAQSANKFRQAAAGM